MAFGTETQTVLSSEKTLSSLLSSMRTRTGTGGSAAQSGFASLLTETGASQVSSRSADEARTVREPEAANDRQQAVDESTDQGDGEGKAARGLRDDKVRATKDDAADKPEACATTDEESQPAVSEDQACEEAVQEASTSDTVAEEGVIASGKKKAENSDEDELESKVAAFIPLAGCPTPQVVSGDAAASGGTDAQTATSAMTTTQATQTMAQAIPQTAAAGTEALLSQTKKKDMASSGEGAQAQTENADALTSALDKIVGELSSAQDRVQAVSTEVSDTAVGEDVLAGLDLQALAQKAANDKLAAGKVGKTDAPVRSTLGQTGQETPLTAPTALNATVAGVAAAAGMTASSSGAQETGASSSPSSSIGLASGVRSAISYGTASELSAARVTKGGATGLPQAVEQVAVQLHKAAKDGTDSITIQLRPGELGKIEVKLDFGADKSVTGTVIADNQTTLNLLQKDEGSLQRALQEAGLQADSGCLEFSLRGDGGQNTFAQSQSESGSFGSSSSRTAAQSDDLSTGETTTGVDSYFLTPGRVNIHV